MRFTIAGATGFCGAASADGFCGGTALDTAVVSVLSVVFMLWSSVTWLDCVNQIVSDQSKVTASFANLGPFFGASPARERHMF